MVTKKEGVVARLLDNSRFWVLSFGLILSLVLLGLVEQVIPPGRLQSIHLEQIYAFISLGLLFWALMVSPVFKLFPNLPAKGWFFHTRRAVGVLAFYYALLHTLIVFFAQLEGFGGIKYLNNRYLVSLIFGMLALFILLAMAATSTDWAVEKLGKNWKRLQRLVYLAVALIIVHVMLVGTHFIARDKFFWASAIALFVLLVFEVARIFKQRASK